METLTLILFVLAVLAFSIQLGFMRNKIVRTVWLLASAVFVYFSHNYAIEQSYDKFTQNLGNINLMTDFVVIQVVEALAGLLLAIFMIRKHFGESVKKFFRFAIYLPGILVFPALFYLSSFTYLNFIGINFQLMAAMLAMAFPLLLWGMHLLIKWIIPEFDIRAEFKFIVHIFQLIGGVILSIQYMKLPVPKLENNQILDAKELGILALAIMVVICFGVLKNQISMKLKMRRLLWKK